MRREARIVRWWSTLASSVLVATLLVVSGGAEQTARTAPVAGSTYLCSGYSGCRSAGYSDDGYGANNGRMYWLMYSGHNCTNYAAYRMIRAGMPNSRPWSGSGMAYNWGKAMKSITDTKPAVGAIAWWDRYHNGIGSSGHVAYVEKVVSATEIVISEDSWNGTFHWRSITRSSGRWPSGFIHFRDVKQVEPEGPTEPTEPEQPVDPPITNTAAPAITGEPQVGVPLTVSRGSWTPSPSSYAYQWQAGGVAIGGATGRTFTPTADQLGKTVTVSVTATKKGLRSATATTPATAVVAKGAYANVTAPALDGTPMLDEELTVVGGSWSPAPETITYRWRAGGKVIQGHTESSLVLTPKLAGKRVSVVEVVKGAGFANAKMPSVSTEKVWEGQIEVTTPFALAGKPELGEQLTVAPGEYTPADAEVTYTWLRDGVAIPDAVGPTYVTTAADLGAQITVSAALSRDSYLPPAEAPLAGLEELIRTRPTVSLRPVGKRRRVAVGIRVTAPGLGPVEGRLLVRFGTKQEWVTLDKGRARVVFAPVAPGVRKVRAFLQAGQTAYGAVERIPVRVLR
ncbi:CHAP domain-containing protein [Nocardioides sp. GY 10113]|uniref:CHAP domain-containing protein n=1 Tax=Nocardioides sp. GY 10113 TaxID=2569761 RepID=UPI001458D731|nr:CHAP domain-containing protein [Nocardioides sp. GY 10113]